MSLELQIVSTRSPSMIQAWTYPNITVFLQRGSLQLCLIPRSTGMAKTGGHRAAVVVGYDLIKGSLPDIFLPRGVGSPVVR